jgi:hypothetical protein
MRLIVHITSQLPPAICGVGDYATLVGQRMEELNPQARCTWIACGHHGQHSGFVPGGKRRQWASNDAHGLWNAIAAATREEHADNVSLLLHYSGYGFHRGGAPKWLADALELRPAPLASLRLVTMFHELYATSWPWRRAFWSSRRQQSAASRIARASDAMMTNREASARWLERQAGRPQGTVPHLPVCSNVGEPNDPVAWPNRQPVAVLFGSPTFKRRFLDGSGVRPTEQLCRKLGIERVIDVGASSGRRSDLERAGIPVQQTGYLPPAQVSQRLETAQLALFDYYPGYFAKSGVLASAAAHATPPVMVRRDGASDDLMFGRHLLTVESLLTMPTDQAQAALNASSRAISDWYRSHTVEKHAARLAEACKSGAQMACAK